MNKCLYLKQRSKKGIKYLYCSKNLKEVNYSDCRDCLDKEYKKHTPIKKVRKNKEKVSKQTYNIVFNRDNGMCVLCYTKQTLQLHHINGRGKDKTDNPDNCIMLCANCHLNVVHKNNKKWRPILNEMIERKNKINYESK